LIYEEITFNLFFKNLKKIPAQLASPPRSEPFFMKKFIGVFLHVDFLLFAKQWSFYSTRRTSNHCV